MNGDRNSKPHPASAPTHAFSSSAGTFTSLMLLRRPLHPNVLRHLLLSRRHLAAATPGTDSPHPHPSDPWIAKALSTAFLLSPSPAAAATRLAALRGLLTPSIAFEAVRRLPDPASALQLFELIRSGFHLDHLLAAYQFLIRFLCRSGFHKDALKVFDEMTGHGHSPDDSFFGFLVESMAEAGQLDAAMGLHARAPEFGCQVRLYTINKLMNLLMARNRVLDAVCLFKEQLGLRSFTPDACSFNIIIMGLCRLGDINRAFEFLREMGDFGCPPDTITYNVLIKGLSKAGQVDRAYGILKGIQSDGQCVPNVVTYTSIMSGYCKMGKMEEAFGVFSEMISFGIRPSRVTYNVLIDGYGKAGDMLSAVSMYDRMVVCGCMPDVVTFTSLIDGYCRSGHLDDAMNLWRQMGERELQPNVYTFAVVINALCKKNRLSEARDLLKELNGRRDIFPRAFIYNPVIDGFCKAGNVDEANSIFVQMEDKSCSPDKITYTILMIGHCMKGRMLDAIALFDRMVATGCAPDNITVSSLVSCLLKAGMPNEANHIMLKTSKKDSRLNISSTSKNPLSLSKNLDISVAA